MTNPECDRLEVNDHLILPVQRVTRYVLLLQDLLKNTETTHPDYSNIVQALDMVRRLSAEVNEAKRKEESMTKLFQIQKEVENCPVRSRPPRVPRGAPPDTDTDTRSRSRYVSRGPRHGSRR